MSPSTTTYEKLRSRIDSLPVIDCHEHAAGPQARPTGTEPITRLFEWYVESDMISAGGEADMALLRDENASTEKKWPVLERLWGRMKHTGYARVTRWILQHEYGVKELTLAALRGIKWRDLSKSEDYHAYLAKHGIRCRLVDLWPDWKKVLAGEHKLPHTDRLLISLPAYHAIKSYGAIQEIAGRDGSRGIRAVTCLDEYVAVCRRQFERLKALGAVGFKDQSAYDRPINYANPTRAAAEELFNAIISDPRKSLGWPQAKDLSDWLFHQFMRMARDLDLPVQLHTGHMAGIRNEITKTNAALLTPVLELHREVRFDLFHGNWPYAGEWLFLAKNYPNVSLDCCWLHIIDPLYARNVLAESVGTVPHCKIHGFGGDLGDSIEFAAAHLSIARDNIAAALAGLVDSGWLGADEAIQIAADWLFNNPNEFFRLGFERVNA